MTSKLFRRSISLTSALATKPRCQPRGKLFHIFPLPSGQRTFSARRPCLSSSKDEDSTNVWKLTQDDESQYWHGYLSTRPKYTDDFYQLMYDYHAARSKSSSFSVAHDVGAGPGHVSAKLSERFSHVVVSDNNKNHVDYARSSLLQSDVPASRFSFDIAMGEELGSRHPAASADLVACALMFPLMDTQAALQSFRSLLKPNGTLAIWFYGRAHFSEAEYASTCQPLLNAIIDHHFGGVIKGGGPEHQAGWKRAADGMASWLDYIPFPEAQWGSVERHKWNSSWTTLPFFGQPACDFPVEPKSSVTENELVLKKEDRELWRKDWDVSELRKFVEYIFPFQSMDEESVKPLWEQLAANMGGSHVKRAFSWPLLLIMASKK
ncbi:uncharacterized protein N7484_005242 [Penicillium longicatenatum]|uniref:uncharacterized protein n=1 Tax=Penicillium longicatenatum TaxID=1561947 RepID=UPI0025470B0E|nr:uncharacterized protein N7484_005242 [Penicillium longicatenatum]KAJ5651519.1 hypothetical protein N7484_005242 [Penicillium longicatenatum]KAJ5670902.1 hypothetical protein N7507_000029 [Penicillium longicatenatum]